MVYATLEDYKTIEDFDGLLSKLDLVELKYLKISTEKRYIYISDKKWINNRFFFLI